MTEKQIFDFFVEKGLTRAGAAGVVGNLIHESGLRADNLQNTHERSLGMTDQQYTEAVDNGRYNNFTYDAAGYGLAQWTFHSRKSALLQFAKSRGVSIADYAMQLDFLMTELEAYGGVMAVLKSTSRVEEASDIFMCQFERPADQSAAARARRAATSKEVYNRCASGVEEPKMDAQTKAANVTVSPLATAKVNFGSTNSNPRKNPVSKITIHHMAGVSSGEACARSHLANPGKQASANYYIGNNGDICAGVSEDRRAWTSGTGNDKGTNDHMAITIEVSNSQREGVWPISDKAYRALIALCADICTRYGIKPHYDGTKNGTLTLHNMFQPTDCPGPYLEGLHKSGQIENDILAAMKNGSVPQKEDKEPEKAVIRAPHKVQSEDFMELSEAHAFFEKLKAAKINATLMKIGGVYRVQAGAYGTKLAANKAATGLKDKGFDMRVTTDQGEPVEYSGGMQYLVRVTADLLNVRLEPFATAPVATVVRAKEAYTIVEEKEAGGYKWGRLKSGAGWVRLDYTSRI